MWWQNPCHLFPQVLQALEDGVMVIDRERRVRVFNQAAARLTGCAVEEALGRTCAEVCRSSLCPCCPVFRMFAGEEPPEQRFQVVLPDRDPPLALLVDNLVLRDGTGMPVGAMAIMRELPWAPATDVGEERARFLGLVGRSKRMQEIYRLIELVAPADAAVLIQGETGTGKELIAEAVHRAGPRASRPLVKLNCSALPETLLEAELFGTAEGPARAGRPGRLELADRGTLFIDEVSDLSLRMQACLLAVLEEETFRRISGHRTIPLTCRLIAATHRDLASLARNGDFLEGLYYRLAMVPIWVPPLRERREDLVLLTEHVLKRLRAQLERPGLQLHETSLAVLTAYDWPGNVRELENVLEYAAVVCPGDRIGVEHLPYYLRQSRVVDDGEAEKEELVAALERHGWHMRATARALGVHRTTLWRRMRRHDIRRPAGSRRKTGNRAPE